MSSWGSPELVSNDYFSSSYSASSQSPPKEFCAGIDLDERLLDDFVDL